MMRTSTLFVVVAVAVAAFVCVKCDAANGDFKFISDKEVEKIEEQWAQEDEIDEDHPINVEKRREARNAKNQAKNMKFTPGVPFNPDEFQTQTEQGKPKMMFASLSTFDKSANEKLFMRFQESLLNGQIPIKTYVIDPAKVLVVVDDGADALKVREFLLEQPEVLEIEMDSKKYLPKKSKAKADEKSSQKVKKEANKKDPKKGEKTSKQEL